MPEIRATMHSEGEVWALLFFDQAHAKQDLKIAWRVTGSGTAAHAQAQSEDGTVLQPTWGPELHSGSNWNHPGSEWGTGFNLPEAGCWTLTIKLGDTEGTISIDVLG